MNARVASQATKGIKIKDFWKLVKDTHRENCVLLNSVQEFIK